MTGVGGIMVLLPAWLATISAFWLVWWAAQSRDATAFRVVAVLLAVVPAFAMPVVAMVVPQYYRGAYASMGLAMALISGAIAISRALFLALWAALSKDEMLLRAVGGAIAGLTVLFYAIGALMLSWINSLNS